LLLVWHVIGETSTQQQSARYRHPSSDIEQQQRRTRESGSNKDKPKLRNTESQEEILSPVRICVVRTQFLADALPN